MLKQIFTLIGLVFAASIQCQNNPKYTIDNIEVLTVNSKYIPNQEFKIHIQLPNNYDKNNFYPVVMVLDGQWDTPLVNGIYGQLYYDGMMSSHIIVGITWAQGTTPVGDLRLRDFTPSKLHNVGGGADPFLSFLNYELMTMLEEKYHAIPEEKTLVGSSLGGLLVLYALFTQPQSFKNYIAASPYVEWDNYKLNDYMKNFHLFENNATKNVFIACGDYDPIYKSVSDFADNFKKQEFSNINVNFESLKGIGHSSAKTISYFNGLKTINQRKVKAVDTDILYKYVGTYHSSKRETAEITLTDDHKLKIKYKEGEFILSADTDRSFYTNSMFLNLDFFTNMEGFKMTTFFQTDFYKK